MLLKTKNNSAMKHNNADLKLYSVTSHFNSFMRIPFLIKWPNATFSLGLLLLCSLRRDETVVCIKGDGGCIMNEGGLQKEKGGDLMVKIV